MRLPGGLAVGSATGHGHEQAESCQDSCNDVCAFGRREPEEWPKQALDDGEGSQRG